MTFAVDIQPAGKFLRFAAVGAVGFLVDAGLVAALASTTGPLMAQLLAFQVASTVTWWLNRRFTFGASEYSVILEWLRYVLSNLAGWAANYAIYAILIWQFGIVRQHPVLAVATGSLAGMLFNFHASRRAVFRPT